MRFHIRGAQAIHNVPEGLAVSLTLASKGTSAVEATLWSVFSSLPQVIVVGHTHASGDLLIIVFAFLCHTTF